MLENSMVCPSLAPEFHPEHLAPKRNEICIICKKTACLVPDDGWYPDYFIADGDAPYVAGEGNELMDAVDTPHGWVCSKLCRSQAMYDHASDSDKQALRKVMEACRVIEDFGKEALQIAEKGMGNPFLSEKITEAANEFLEAVYGVDDMPKWCV